MDEIESDDFADTDTVLVIGANDTVAWLRRSPPGHDRPVCRFSKCGSTDNRGLLAFNGLAGAGVQNPLFFKENTRKCCLAMQKPAWMMQSESLLIFLNVRRLFRAVFYTSSEAASFVGLRSRKPRTHRYLCSRGFLPLLTATQASPNDFIVYIAFYLCFKSLSRNGVLSARRWSVRGRF